MANKNEPSSKVTIGSVSGNIVGSVIAGRDVTNTTITIGGRRLQADKDPTVEELRKLLEEIQRIITEIVAQKESLQAISASAPHIVQGVEADVTDTTAKLEGEVERDEAESVQKSLTDATNLLSTLLEGAKTVAQKSNEVGRAIKPIVNKLEPLIEMLGVAILWAGKLYLGR